MEQDLMELEQMLKERYESLGKQFYKDYKERGSAKYKRRFEEIGRIIEGIETLKQKIESEAAVPAHDPAVPSYDAPEPTQPDYGETIVPSYDAPEPTRPDYGGTVAPSYDAPEPTQPDYGETIVPSYDAPEPTQPDYGGTVAPSYDAPEPTRPDYGETMVPSYEESSAPSYQQSQESSMWTGFQMPSGDAQPELEPININVCAKCGSELQEGAAFCIICGARTQTKPQENFGQDFHSQMRLDKICPNCGSVVTTTFCTKCGTKV